MRIKPVLQIDSLSKEGKKLIKRQFVLWVVLTALLVLLTAGLAEAKPDYVSNIPAGLDKSCNLCHSSVPALNDFGKKWVAAGKDFNAVNKPAETKAAAPAATAKPADTKAAPPAAATKPAASKVATVTKRSVTITYGAKSVKINAEVVKGHLQVPASIMTDLLGIKINDSKATIALRKLALELGLTVNYNAGKVELYGTVKPIGQFGKNQTLALPGYVGPQTCKGCHSGMAEKWQTTKHATMVQDINDPNLWIAADFHTNTFFSKDDVKYAIAQGQRFVEMKDGKLMYMSATWNLETNQWVKANPSAYSCGKCHNTGFNEKTGYWFENGVTCESCHGPGAEHAKSADPSKIRVSTGIEMCQPCHDEGSHDQVTKMVADAKAEQADDANVKSHLNVLKDSKVQGASYGDNCTKCHSADVRIANEKGETPPKWEVLKDGPRNGITCVVCHDPHQNTGNERQLKITPDDNEACITCHTNDGPLVAGKVAHHPQKEWFDGKLIGLSIEAPSGHQCATCHMVNGSHSFDAPKPSISVISHGAEVKYDPCASCHSDMTKENIAQIQHETEKAYEELSAELKAVGTKLEAAKAAGTDVTEAQNLYNANITNVGFLESEGSLGIHNNDLTEAVIKKAETDLVKIKSLLGM